jgi:DNA repair exonuclease SbcCD ATPase subunit
VDDGPIADQISGLVEPDQPSTPKNKRQRTTRFQQQTPIIISDDDPAPRPNFESIQVGLDQLKRQHQNTERENERLLAEVEVLRTYKQHQEDKEHTAQDSAAELEELKARTRREAVERMILRSEKRQQEIVQLCNQDLATELEELGRAHKQLQEAMEFNERAMSARLEELRELKSEVELAWTLQNLSDPVYMLKMLSEFKLVRQAREQEIKDQMEATDEMHDAVLHHKLDQAKKMMQQVTGLTKAITGPLRNLEDARERLREAVHLFVPSAEVDLR